MLPFSVHVKSIRCIKSTLLLLVYEILGHNERLYIIVIVHSKVLVTFCVKKNLYNAESFLKVLYILGWLKYYPSSWNTTGPCTEFFNQFYSRIPYLSAIYFNIFL